MPNELHLSQDLNISNFHTISIPGETESYFATCSLDGESEWLPKNECWYALTDKAKQIWRGEIEVRDGITFGRLFIGGAKSEITR